MESITSSFIVLNAMMENEDIFLRSGKGLKTFLFSIKVFNMMRLPSILQVKAGKTKIKKSYRGSIWSHFSGRHWLSSFIIFLSCSAATSGIVWSFFLTERNFHVSKCNIKEQWVYWSFPVLFYSSWRNIVPIYLLSTIPWIFIFRT